MKLRTKVSLILTGIILLTSLATGYFVYRAQMNLIEQEKSRELNMVAMLIQNTLQERANEALARASLIGSIPAVRSAFRAGDREYLTDQLLSTVTLQHDSFDLRQASFWYPPASSFLILFDLKRPVGEDVSSYREILTTASRRQEAQKGIEIGRSGLALRGVFPIKDEQGFIGVLDVATNFAALASEVKNSTGYEIGIFVKNDILAKTATNVSSPESEYIIGGLRNVQATDWRVIKAVATPDLLSYTKDVNYATAVSSNGYHGWLTVPLNDFAGRTIGTVVATRSFSHFERQAWRAVTNAAILAIIQAVLIIGVALIVIRGMVLKPLGYIGECLDNLASGNDFTIDPQLTKRNDEIGKILKVLGMLNSKMTKTSQPRPEDH